MNQISVEQQIDLAIAYRATNLSVIARAMGITRQTLHRKLIRNTLKKEDLRKIAKILGAEYVSYFSFPGGIEIGKEAAKGRKARSRKTEAS